MNEDGDNDYEQGSQRRPVHREAGRWVSRRNRKPSINKEVLRLRANDDGHLAVAWMTSTLVFVPVPIRRGTTSQPGAQKPQPHGGPIWLAQVSISSNVSAQTF